MADPDSSGLDLLDEDIMGELLPLLTVDDIKSARLCCKGWHRSIQHRTRTLSAFYLPLAAPQHPLSSLEVVQLPLIRPVQQHLLQLPPRLQASHNTQSVAAEIDIARTESAAALAAAARNLQAFTSLAPLRGLSAAGVQGLSHASVVNLTGQQLPYNVLKLLSQHMTRLKSLQLDYCRLPAPALLHATGLTTLQSLSLAGMKLQGGFHQHVKEAIAAAATAAADVDTAHTGAAAAAAAVVSAAAAAADYIEQAGPAQQRQARTTTGAASSKVASAWVAEQQSTVASRWQLPPAACSLVGWASSRLAGLTAADHGVLLDAVLLPQLQQLNLDVPAKPLVG
jgi:hypothetical protein